MSARLQHARPLAFGLLGVLVLGQGAWTAHALLRGHARPSELLYPLLFLPAALALWASRGRVPLLALPARLLIGFSFVWNVADRLGLRGPPGTPGVGWGDFAHFVTYTAEVNAFAPPSWAPALAVLATLAEGALGVLLLLGVRPRLAAAGAALLLLAFATAMVLSGLSQAEYAVYLMAAGAGALATADGIRLRLPFRVARRTV
ncbi:MULTISPECIES: DoxX family membrane protein [Myxococcaceae]|uniref:DoxX family membrane protein n=1 Tax=Myxococcaceae TaxID=31 RepID=UPI00188FBEAD|nr:DoxX family membrane protein [Simulacricoccus sp. 17bor-14]